LRARYGRHSLELRPIRHEVEFPEPLPALLHVAARVEHVEAKLVVFPTPSGEGFRAVGARTHLHRREKRIESHGSAMRGHELAGDVAVALRGLPKLVALVRVADGVAADLADEPFVLWDVLGVP